jgi:hypothetical protein
MAEKLAVRTLIPTAQAGYFLPTEFAAPSSQIEGMPIPWVKI